ncbi:hypothetical protein ACGFWF_28395 [Streptomyces sp. NPDC048581]|uniref:hypothetical protein n=1 Tax=Streptomyces sp. NPDC048581 TaxID=3365572 RepID=UPI0037154DEA
MNRTASTQTPKLSRKKAALAAGISAAALLGAFVTTQAADTPSADGKPGRTVAAPYVLNLYGEEYADAGHPERRPANLVLSEFTHINNVKWKQWGAKKAYGTGEVGGTWCLPACLDKPLKGTITLSDPKTVKGRTFYSAFTLKLSGKPGTYDSEDLQGKHALATP